MLEAALTPANEVVPASTLSRELEKAVLARVKFDNPAEFRERMSRSELRRLPHRAARSRNGEPASWSAPIRS